MSYQMTQHRAKKRALLPLTRLQPVMARGTSVPIPERLGSWLTSFSAVAWGGRAPGGARQRSRLALDFYHVVGG